MRKNYALKRLKDAGYDIKFVGWRIEASKCDKVYRGSINSVFIEVFNYKIYY